MQTLEKEGFLQFGLRGGLLPGERLHVAALNILRSSRHKALRQAILRQLSEAIGETCGLAIPDGLDMLYFDRVQTNWPLQINLPIGSHTPLWCTASGKLYLASLPPEQLERVLPRLPLQRMARNTLTDLSALRDDLPACAKNSWVPTARSSSTAWSPVRCRYVPPTANCWPACSATRR